MNSFKSIATHRIFIALVSFFLGVVCFKAYERVVNRNHLSHDQSLDLFEEMGRMREQMLGQLDAGDVGEITQREDKDFLYFEINLKGQAPKNFNVNVENGQVAISGETESKKPDGTFVSSQFERSFPVPAGVNAEKLKLEQESDKVIIKFPKQSNP